ncbi:MAG TPA: phage baseplate assembly protein V [Thermoanaerobaculia bacterium]|nr:phage baseplate assembly protein V [Thermoanaerobaculia bacterium]
MKHLPGFTKWSVSLAAGCFLILALASTRPTRAQDADRPEVLRRVLGLRVAVVVDINDPSAAGRIKVEIPSLTGSLEAWARVSLPLGGNRTGLWALPEVGDEVVVAFENGDVSRPFVIGSLWDGKKPPTSTP